MSDDYIFQTEPFPHQKEAFDRSKDMEVFALFMEPRTGKTKIIVDTTARLYEQGKITGVLVVAWPTGVHRNWITDEYPAHFPKRLKWSGFIWRAARWKLKHVQKSFDDFLSFNGLRVFAINAEALGGEDCRKAIGRFIKACGGRERLFGVGDETLFMQTPSSLRAKVMANIKKHVKYRRILDGTPISNMGPFGLFSQVGWLDPAILGHSTFVAFKTHYSEMELQGDAAFTNTLSHMRRKLAETEPDMSEKDRERLAIMTASRKGRSWVGPAKDEKGRIRFRNMSELTERLAPYSYRKTFYEVFKDVPRPIYQKRYFEMGKEQRRIYDLLRDEHRAELASGVEIDGTMAMVRYLRLQQVTSNFVPPKQEAVNCPDCTEETREQCLTCQGIGFVVEEKPMERISKDNPRIEILRDFAKTGDQWLIWARFNQEIDDILALGRELGLRIGRYDGQTSYDEKAKAREDFQQGKIDWLAAKQTSAGRGIPLWKARGHIYVSNFWSLDARQQSERRTEISHRRTATEIIDLVAEDSIDDNLIIPSLRAHLDVASRIMGDPKRDWL